MHIQKTKAFTLVELIVVITILAILWTIAFISLQWYSERSRDSVRVTDMKTMKNSLELLYQDTNKYPMSKFFAVGDFVFANVTEVSDRRYVRLSARNRPYRKLYDGIVIEVSPTKIPRIIGKQGSMIKMLKEDSGCDILVGQNGWVWIKHDDPEKQMIMVNAIKTIETESHTSGLTEKVKNMLRGGAK